MAARDILTLNTDMASRLIRIVYALALVLLTLAALAGVARGITRMVHIPQSRLALAGGNGATGQGRMAMNRQRPAPAQAAADAPPSAAAPAPSANVPAPAPQDGMMGPRGMRDGMGRRGMMGRHRGRFGMHRGGRRFGPRGLLGHLPPVAQGGLMILRTLVMAAIGIMLARVLAELAGAVLTMGVKARQA